MVLIPTYFFVFNFTILIAHTINRPNEDFIRRFLTCNLLVDEILKYSNWHDNSHGYTKGVLNYKL